MHKNLLVLASSAALLLVGATASADGAHTSPGTSSSRSASTSSTAELPAPGTSSSKTGDTFHLPAPRWGSTSNGPNPGYASANRHFVVVRSHVTTAHK
ncbi:MAG TPA: hypothetical protein VGI39_43045 [Polyangiaceae bacterium]